MLCEKLFGILVLALSLVPLVHQRGLFLSHIIILEII